jgi:hypothetical protein
MNGIGPLQGSAYLSARQTARGRLGAGTDQGFNELRGWLAICAAIALASGVLGWKIGSARGDTPEPNGAMASVRLNPRPDAQSVVTALPFGTVDEAAKQYGGTPQPPPLPFNVLRGYNGHNQPIVLIERDGKRVVASEVAVYGDYLVQLEDNRVVFTYLPTAVRQSVYLPTAAERGRVPARAAAGRPRPVDRTPSTSYQATRAQANSADEEAERD